MKKFDKLIKTLPPVYAANLLDANRKEFLLRDFTIVVLDDDPTGTQTIFDVPVLTTWGEKEILFELENKVPLFFILTNSRSLVAEKADQLAVEIGENIKSASEKTGRKTIVISRGDSTLRGHYPNEVDALGRGLEIEGSPQILIPAFFQGGRHTVNDIHYVLERENLIPVAETPFAKDTTFGYHSSNLKYYVEEKSKGKISANDVKSISINDIRLGGPEKVLTILNSLNNNDVCAVNAMLQSDLDVFTAGFYLYIRNQKPVLFRTAASIIPSLAGVPVKAPLQNENLELKGQGGVVAIGSYVPKTSLQLDFLKKHFNVEYVEIQAGKLLQKTDFTNEVNRVSDRINQNLLQNQIVVVYTSREVITGANADESLKIVNQISKGMVEIIKRITVQPRFFIAKGGITSSDIVTKSFKVKKAKVLGQIIPGVPVWELTDCPQFPGLKYMPFPGNLGGDETLYQAIRKFN